jgi:hypothetical protein
METEMKRILAALGVTGLALLGAAAPATAGDNSDDDHRTITICHATGSESHPYVELDVDFHAVKEHAWHDDDIIPAGKKWDGKNWDEDGRAIYYNGCVPCPPEVVTPEQPPEVVTPEQPPVVTPEQPPVVTPEQPPVVTPEQPPVVTPEQPPVVTPIGAVVAPPAAPAVVVKNPGFNVQTAVAASDGGLAPWAAGLIVMVLAAGGVAARRMLPAGGAVSGEGKD